VSDYRRPREKWCTDTAIRLVQMGAREPLAEPRLLSHADALVLFKAAAILDSFGQRTIRERAQARA
jgi:hypothetical protein